ncbi:hypothetical protein H310_10299 [Aphanomyces invadans]|uniref:Uncharacterized protein n=1 Tax=Aphanomyces invadans TaxID=157072 RepID=A0A024TTE2_9STRA|nr:hypothetical protein H310_10299 [Aphanomyces invadans]ETV96597.1 hypothetical protein H310_10299 [Aphanomyces invadans]|eukprot:XP_008874860.1 hypothetical protein H310_10299 [Aphanomyces invadans]
MGDGIMKDSGGFAWMWGTTLVCLVCIGYFIWKKKGEATIAFATPARVPSEGSAEDGNNVYAPNTTPVVSTVPSKIV